MRKYQKYVITEVQGTTRACTSVPRGIPSGTSSRIYSAQRRIDENSSNDLSQIPKQRNEGRKTLKNTSTRLDDPCLLPQWSKWGKESLREIPGVP